MILTWLISQPVLAISWIAAILITLTIHEFAHAASAKYFGDNTAEVMGRMSLNPISHLDPLGFAMLLIIGFGWAKPVPVNPYNFKNPRVASGLVSLAGPIANLIGVLFFGLIFKLLFSTLLFSGVLRQVFLGVPIYDNLNFLAIFLVLLVLINALLMIFNLIPIPPLDGSKVLFSLLPDRYDEFKVKFSIKGPLILMIAILMDMFLNLGIFSGFFNFIVFLISIILG